MKIALIGGNPKGFLEPFDRSTLSGRRLRRLIAKLGLDCKLCDMTKNRNDVPSTQEIENLKKEVQGYTVVFLGRFVERQLKSHFPLGIYLPHPASRRNSDQQKLEEGLRNLRKRVFLSKP